MIKVNKISKRKYKLLEKWTQEVIEKVCAILNIPKRDVIINIKKRMYDRANFNWHNRPPDITIRYDQTKRSVTYKHSLAHEYVHYLDWLKYGTWHISYGARATYTARFFKGYFEHRAEGIARLLYPKAMTKSECFILDNVKFIPFPKEYKRYHNYEKNI